MADRGEQPGVLRQQPPAGGEDDGPRLDVLAHPPDVAALCHRRSHLEPAVVFIGVFRPQHRVGTLGDGSPGHDPAGPAGTDGVGG